MIPGIAAHLWQSTLFGGAAWLAALALRTNRAEARYWIWLAASVKFVIPFTLLVGLGTLAPHDVTAAPSPTEWVAALEEFGQPLMLPTVAAHVGNLGGGTSRAYLAAAGFAVWVCGFAAITNCWLRRWRRVHALRSAARSIQFPGVELQTPVMSVPDLVEPGIFGILRPVLLLPEGIAERLNQTQLAAILAHEFCHVRRRDNLTAALHMAVQAIFWFHPLTWWIGARLVEERERACDEEVLRLGCKPNVYAESILMICKLYLSSPLACVPGVTGSDLKRRIESIMRNRSLVRLSLAKKAALGVAGMAVLAAPIAVGVLNRPARAQEAADWQTKAGGKMAFEVASVKLSQAPHAPPAFPLDPGDAYSPTGGHFRADVPLWTYIQFAYKIWPAENQRREMLARLPGWVTTDRYSIEARAAGSPSKDQMRLMMQSLLADRFQLSVRYETHEAPIFELTLVKPGKLGPNLRSHADGPACDAVAEPYTGRGFPDVFPPVCDTYALLRRPGGMLMGSRNTTTDLLASSISGPGNLGRPVVNKTGLSGRFDFRLEWAPDPDASATPNADVAPPDSMGPNFTQALRDELGLKLEAAKGPIQILVIDKVQRPSEN